MTTDATVKKRGRPKSAELLKSIQDQATDQLKPKRTKSTTTAREFSTTEAISQKSLNKKPTRKKQTTIVDGEDGDLSPPLKKSVKASTTKSKTKSTILDQAKAFETSNDVINNDKIAAGESLSGTVDTSSNSKKGLEEMSTRTTTASIDSARQSIPIAKSLLSIDNSTQSPSPDSLSTTNRSSFLSDFLSRSDPTPEVLKDSKISDRSAFTNKTPSIEEIVSGIGVSNLAALEAATSVKKAQPTRDSAIPITLPKAFKGLTLSRFPDRPEPSKPSRKIDPATYAVGSFSSFKSTQPLSTPASMSKSPSLNATDPILMLKSQTQPLISHQQHATLQTTSKSQPIAPNMTQPSAPVPSPSSQPSRPAASSPSAVSQPPAARAPTSIPPYQPTAPRIPSIKQPKRPTEMSPAELRKNPEFKSLRRKWTGLIVGIPVLVATSYVLWNRLDLDVSQQEGGGLGWDYAGKAQSGRERGMIPGRSDAKTDEDVK